MTTFQWDMEFSLTFQVHAEVALLIIEFIGSFPILDLVMFFQIS